MKNFISCFVLTLSVCFFLFNTLALAQAQDAAEALHRYSLWGQRVDLPTASVGFYLVQFRRAAANGSRDKRGGGEDGCKFEFRHGKCVYE